MSRVADRPLRVLEIITTPLMYDGQTRFPLRVVSRMDSGRVRADFLSFRLGDERIRDEIEAMGAQLHLAPHRLKHPLKYIRAVSKVIRENRYDAVHIHASSCIAAVDLLAAKLGGAGVRIAHSHNTQCRYTALHRLLKPLFNRLYTHAMACGEEAGRWMFGSKPFTVVRNAVDIRAFSFDPEERKSVRAEFGLKDETVYGCVAHFTPAKNHAFLLEVFASLAKEKPDIRLVLVGDGPLKDAAVEQAKALGISDRVIFTGVRTDVSRLLQMMDAMLLPSLHEGFPTVAMEWQCAGLPVFFSEAVTRDCAFAENVRFLPHDVNVWKDALLTLPETDRESAARSGAQAVSEAGYDLAAVSQQLQADYIRFCRS